MSDEQTRALERAAAAGDPEAAEAVVVAALRERRWRDVVLAVLSMGVLGEEEEKELAAELCAMGARRFGEEVKREDAEACARTFERLRAMLPERVESLTTVQRLGAELLLLRAPRGSVGHLLTQGGWTLCSGTLHWRDAAKIGGRITTLTGAGSPRRCSACMKRTEGWDGRRPLRAIMRAEEV